MKQLLKDILAVYMTRRGKKREFSTQELESLHADHHLRSFNDSSYFAGISSEGFVFVTRQSFRTDKPNENWMMVSIPGDGVWGFGDRPMKQGKGFVQGSLEYVCTVPGEEWKIRYEGLLPRGEEEAELLLDLTWKATTPLMVFDKVGTTPLQVGKQIARENWNKRYFRKLKELDQVHYEQAGTLTGTFKWKGRSNQLEFIGLRDHSWGVRNWEDWDRHFWLVGVLEDGRFFNFSLISYTFVKNLQAAFIFDGERTHTIYRIHNFNELEFDELMPTSFSLPVEEFKNGPVKKLAVNMLNFFPFMMDKVYFIRQAEATFEYGGSSGVGIAEMGINPRRYGIDIRKTYQ